MKKCWKCNNVYDDRFDECPECHITLTEYTHKHIEYEKEHEREKQYFAQQRIRIFLYICIVILAFFLGIGFKSRTGIKNSDYYKLLEEKDNLSKEYAAYKYKMKPYEKQQETKEKAVSANQNTLPTTASNTNTSSVNNSDTDTKRLMQLYLDDLQANYPNAILKVEAYSDVVFNIWFSNSWYSLDEQEKEYLTNSLYTNIRNRYIEVSGKSDGLMSLTLYDQNSKTLAKSKTLGGIELK